jgi:hypothetical protein
MGEKQSPFKRPTDPLEMVRIEAEFSSRLLMFRNELESVNQFFYAYMALHGEIRDTRDVERLLIQDFPLVTSTLLGSLQMSIFISLGRIFENTDTYNVNSLRGFACRHRWMFDLDRLGCRKESLGFRDPVQLGAYLKEAVVPTLAMFKELKKSVAIHQRVYKDKIEPIRNQWFAHREIDPVTANQLFSKTVIAEFESLMSFLSEYERVLNQLFYNGVWEGVAWAIYSWEGMKDKIEDDSRITAIQHRITSQIQRFLRRAASAPV